MHSKREILSGGGLLLALSALNGCSAAAATRGTIGPLPEDRPVKLDFPGTEGPMPWIKRVFHLYTGPDGLTRADQLEVTQPKGRAVATLLHRDAVRIRIGGTQPNAGFDFHVANNPSLMIVIAGTKIIRLHDGSEIHLQNGDICYAEDCTGKGHISVAGPEGAFMALVQLPKERCPAVGSSDMTKVWKD